VLVAATILLAGGFAVASNMGFKLNKPLAKSGNGQIGNNFTSIPFNNPYVNFAGFCAQSGVTTDTTLELLDGGNPPSFKTTTCTAPAAQNLVPGWAMRIRSANAPASIIIVGSHNPVQTVTVPANGPGNQGFLWFSVPYHTTAVTASDLCTQIGLNGATIQRLDAATGTFFGASPCPGVDAARINLVLGEGVILRQPKFCVGGPTPGVGCSTDAACGAGGICFAKDGITFIPAHY